MAEVILSYGHGVNTFPETGSKGVIVGGVRYAEHTFNAKVGEMTRKILVDHGVSVMVVQPPNGKDVSLTTRINKANATNAKLYYSIHANAGDKDAKGVCAFYHGYGSTAEDNEKKAKIYAKHAKAEGLTLYHGGTWGSTKNGWNDFRETKEPKMFSVITENGFMTNKEDFELIFKNKNNYYDKIARVHAKTILEILGKKYKGESKPAPVKKPTPAPAKPKPSAKKDLHRVTADGKQVGAFGEDKNVVAAVEKALKDGKKNIKIEEV